MTAIPKILFPWQGAFKQLGLRARWWHRLAIVVFFIALLPVLGASWVLAFSSLEPAHRYMPETQYWAMDTDGNLEQVTLGPIVTQAQHDAAVKQHKENATEYSTPLPVGAYAVTEPPGATIDESIPLKAKVEMPDGRTGEFIGKSDAEITVVWNEALHKAVRTQWLLSVCIAVALTLAFSYLIQLLYRASLYVAYGAISGRGKRNGEESV